MCRYKNAGVAGYAEAFIPVQSDSQASEWYRYFENAVPVLEPEVRTATAVCTCTIRRLIPDSLSFCQKPTSAALFYSFLRLLKYAALRQKRGNMEHLIIPGNYSSALNLHDTQIGIKTVKDFFQSLLVRHLNLLRVSAPLFVDPASGMNDNLNGYERPVSFGILEHNDYRAEVVVPCKMETLRPQGIRIFSWRRSLHGYERHPPRRND